MNQELSTAEQRLLWMLVANPNGEFETILKLSNPKPVREALSRAGLIEVEKRFKEPKVKGSRAATFLRLTDAGWAWCNQNLYWTKPRGKAENLLNSLLVRLKTLIERQESPSSLADFINKSNPDPNQASSSNKVASNTILTPPQDSATLEERIRTACLDLGGGREAVRVRIADLRHQLRDVAHEVLTEGVRDLSRRHILTLYPLDDPRQITADDKEAAIFSSTGVPQHILYYGGIVS